MNTVRSLLDLKWKLPIRICLGFIFGQRTVKARIHLERVRGLSLRSATENVFSHYRKECQKRRRFLMQECWSCKWTRCRCPLCQLERAGPRAYTWFVKRTEAHGYDTSKWSPEPHPTPLAESPSGTGRPAPVTTTTATTTTTLGRNRRENGTGE